MGSPISSFSAGPPLLDPQKAVAIEKTNGDSPARNSSKLLEELKLIIRKTEGGKRDSKVK